MKDFKNDRYNQISLFTNILDSLNKLFEEDNTLFTAKYHQSLCHRLGMYLEDELRSPDETGHLFDSNIFVDVSYPIPWLGKNKKSDIVIHQRGESPILSAFITNKYLSYQDLLDLYNIQTKNPNSLYLYIRIANNKNYALVYKAGKESIEYYHCDYKTKTSSMNRIRTIKDIKKDKNQLKLFKRNKK